VKAEILRMEFYSAHADRNELLRYLDGQDRKQVKSIFLVHGIDRSREHFQEELKRSGFAHVVLPHQRETFTL
jgi:metallo-beta-lactamase family protein